MVKGILKRLFPVLCCIVVLISCMVVPASAAGMYVSPGESASSGDSGYTPRVSFTAYFQSNTIPASDGVSITMQSSIRSGDQFDSYGDFTYDNGFASSFSLLPEMPSYPVISAPNVFVQGYYKLQNTLVDGNSISRIHERIHLNRSFSGSYVREYATWLLHFDPFGGFYDREFLRELFWVDGQYSYIVSGTFFTIIQNKLVSYDFEFAPFSSNGQQSILTANYLNNIEKNTGITEGQPYWISDLKVDFLFSEAELAFSRSADYHNSLTNYLSSTFDPNDPGSSLFEFLTAHGLITGPSQSFVEGGDVTDFLAGAASSVFDFKLFGDFSLGNVFGVLLAVSVLFWILKLFAGG